MKRSDLIVTTMALTTAIFMSAAVSGCGANTQTVTASTQSSSTIETVVSSYSVNQVSVPYPAIVIKDTKLITDMDSNKLGTAIKSNPGVTVIGEVLKSNEKTDFYQVELEDNKTKGFLSKDVLDFNIDYDASDDLKEVANGDGETAEDTTTAETESTVAESTEAATEEAFKSYKCFTNTKCNIRADATKNSELIGTADVNTEITVTGVKGDWSAISYNGMTGYIKSSLLSETKVAVKQTSQSSSKSSTKSSSKSSGSSSAGNTPASTPSSNQDSDDNSSDDNADWSFLNKYPSSDDMTSGGGGTGGATGGNMNVE